MLAQTLPFLVGKWFGGVGRDRVGASGNGNGFLGSNMGTSLFVPSSNDGGPAALGSNGLTPLYWGDGAYGDCWKIW